MSRNFCIRTGIIALFVLASFGLSGCSGLQMASYKGPGDFQSPDRFGDSRSGGYHSGDFSLIWPVNHVRINQHFKDPSNRRHKGLDLGGSRNTSILAAHDGVVVYTGQNFSGYGKMILIEYNSQWATLYAHLNKINIKEGQRVQAGDLIGKMGRTGRATGVHLHFEVMKNKTPVDPLKYLRLPENIVSK